MSKVAVKVDHVTMRFNLSKEKVDNLKNIVDVIQTPTTYAMSAYFIDIEGNIHSAYAYKD